MKSKLSLISIKITLIIILCACGMSKNVMNVNLNTPLPPDIAKSSGIDDEAIESDETCEIELNGNSIHDMIQIFESPRFDLLNPIGGLSMNIGCVDDCPLLRVAVQGKMMTPQIQCEIDRQTCGLWYQVDWGKYTDSIPISGWVSDQDDDIKLVGDCMNLAEISPETIFTQTTEHPIHP